MTDLEMLLKMYREERDRFCQSVGGKVVMEIELTPEFLNTCERRIIEGSSKYGDDWKYKDCMAEQQFEVYDYINYILLDACQKRVR